MDRNDTMRDIKAALKRRSGKPWSVTGGRGTAWGWLTIDAPPKRRTAHAIRREGALTDRPEDYEIVDTGVAGGYATPADRAELGRLLGLDSPVHMQGVSIPAGSDYYDEYVDRAHGRTPRRYGKQYWD